MSAPFRPGISSPFLIRRMRRMGSISAPTFSSSPRMNASEGGQCLLYVECVQQGLTWSRF